jgi:hypothetical protein
MRTKYIYSLLILGIISIFLDSCTFECLEGNGILETEHRIVAEFQGVENTTSFDVEIMADSAYSVEVTADENLLPYIDIYVRSGNLTIETSYNYCINSHNYVRIEIHMPVLDYIELSGSGDIDAYEVEGNHLHIINSGSGDINVNDLYLTSEIDIDLHGSGDVMAYGKVRHAEYNLSGSGDILANDLLADVCIVKSSGSGDVYCFAYDLLNVTINGSGDILYSGSPDTVELVDNGSGELIERN